MIISENLFPFPDDFYFLFRPLPLRLLRGDSASAGKSSAAVFSLISPTVVFNSAVVYDVSEFGDKIRS